jgi:nitrous oxidase accessory protein NosD
MSARNVIAYNNITGNTGYGILLDMCDGGGEYNLVHHNNFFSNRGEEGQVTERGSPVNYWNDSYPSGGNYWDDYHGIDVSPRDGFGDTPYSIPGGLNKDYFPLMKPYGKSKNKALSPVEGSQLERLVELFPVLWRLLNL